MGNRGAPWSLALVAAVLCLGAYSHLGTTREWRCHGFKGWRQVPSGGLIIDCANNVAWARQRDPWFGTINEGRKDPLTLRTLEALKKETPAGGVAIDFGAGTGFYAFQMLDLVGPKGEVHAIDRDRAMVNLLRETARVTRRPNLHAQMLEEEFGAHFSRGSVDLVNAAGLGLTCDQMRRFVSACARVLKPTGGAIFDITPWHVGHDGSKSCSVDGVSKIVRGVGLTLQPWTPGGQLHLMRRASATQ